MKGGGPPASLFRKWRLQFILEPRRTQPSGLPRRRLVVAQSGERVYNSRWLIVPVTKKICLEGGFDESTRMGRHNAGRCCAFAVVSSCPRAGIFRQVLWLPRGGRSGFG